MKTQKLKLIKWKDPDPAYATIEITTTVSELRQALKQYPDNTPVFSEGCDCTGNVVAITQEEGGEITLNRNTSLKEVD